MRGVDHPTIRSSIGRTMMVTAPNARRGRSRPAGPAGWCPDDPAIMKADDQPRTGEIRRRTSMAEQPNREEIAAQLGLAVRRR